MSYIELERDYELRDAEICISVIEVVLGVEISGPETFTLKNVWVTWGNDGIDLLASPDPVIVALGQKIKKDFEGGKDFKLDVTEHEDYPYIYVGKGAHDPDGRYEWVA